MRQLQTSHYAISRLVMAVFQQSGLSRSIFVQSLGYKNINSGLRALDGWIEMAEGSPFLLESLVKLRGLDAGVVRKALEETDQAQQREKERFARKNFRPYVFVETSRERPTSITVAACLGLAMKFIRLHKRRTTTGEIVADIPESQRLAAVQAI